MGSHDTLRTLPKSPRRLRILAKACSSRKSHIHCAAPRGVRVDQRLAGEITCGTSKNTRFYKVLTMPSRAWLKRLFYKLFEHFADLLQSISQSLADNG